MAFGVRQWPEPPDPRGSFFSFEGWNWGQVAPWQWVLNTNDATGLWSFLNDGFVIPSTFDNGVTTTWFANVPASGGTDVSLAKFGTPTPVGIPPRTIQLTLSVFRPGPTLIGQGVLTFVFPDAIRVFGPLAMLSGGLPIPDLPNGITITPAIWDFVLP